MAPVGAPRHTYRGLVVDYGGVLTTSIASSMAVFCAATGVSADQRRRRPGRRVPAARGRDVGEERAGASLSLSHRLVDLETGRYDTDEFESLLAVALSEGLAEPLARAGLIDRLFASVTLDERMIRAVSRARQHGVKTAVLSNTWGRGVFHPEVLESFDAVLLSERGGLRKPDQELYRVAARRLGLCPEERVFIDDLPTNVEGALAVGMAAILHERADLTIPRLEKLLGVDLGER